jgi:hypothetical protein
MLAAQAGRVVLVRDLDTATYHTSGRSSFAELMGRGWPNWDDPLVKASTAWSLGPLPETLRRRARRSRSALIERDVL